MCATGMVTLTMLKHFLKSSWQHLKVKRSKVKVKSSYSNSRFLVSLEKMGTIGSTFLSSVEWLEGDMRPSEVMALFEGRCVLFILLQSALLITLFIFFVLYSVTLTAWSLWLLLWRVWNYVFRLVFKTLSLILFQAFYFKPSVALDYCFLMAVSCSCTCVYS